MINLHRGRRKNILFDRQYLISPKNKQVLGIINKALTMKAFPMEEIFSSPAVDYIETVLDFDLNYVILGCVILFLSYVFQYGRTLQVEADETL